MSEYDHIIGRASDLAPNVSTDTTPLLRQPVHPVVSLEELERPSKEKGHPDPGYPDIDTRDPLYIPRFLIRKWGSDKFERSAYWALWRQEAARRPSAIPKPVRK